jgi:hypothetical protein
MLLVLCGVTNMLLSPFLQVFDVCYRNSTSGKRATCILGVAQVWFVYQAVFCGTFIDTLFGTFFVVYETRIVMEYDCSLDFSTSAIIFNEESQAIYRSNECACN